jgi:hypothetical protein
MSAVRRACSVNITPRVIRNQLASGSTLPRPQYVAFGRISICNHKPSRTFKDYIVIYEEITREQGVFLE